MSKYIVMQINLDGDQVETQVEADSITVKDKCLIFLTDKKIVRAFAEDQWLEVLKIS